MSGHCSVKVSLLPDKIQEEFLELKCNCVAKDDFETVISGLNTKKLHACVQEYCNVAMRILQSFSATYLCQRGISALIRAKTKLGTNLIMKSICDVHFLQRSQLNC